MPGPLPFQPLTYRPLARFGPKPTSLEERFWRKVIKGEGDSCYLWQNNLNGKAGYGMLYDRDTGRKELAHRVAWKLEHGEYPKNTLLHTCDTPACVRAKHLFEGTQALNMLDKARKGRSSNQHVGLTLEQFEWVLAQWAEGESQTSIAEKLAVHQTYISRIVRGEITKFGGDAVSRLRVRPAKTRTRVRVGLKLDEDDIREIRGGAAQGCSQLELAKRYGVSKARIAQILEGKAWAHVP